MIFLIWTTIRAMLAADAVASQIYDFVTKEQMSALNDCRVTYGAEVISVDSVIKWTLEKKNLLILSLYWRDLHSFVCLSEREHLKSKREISQHFRDNKLTRWNVFIIPETVHELQISLNSAPKAGKIYSVVQLIYPLSWTETETTHFNTYLGWATWPLQARANERPYGERSLMAQVLLVILLSSAEYTLTYPEQMCHARAVTEDHFHFFLFSCSVEDVFPESRDL